MFDDLKPYLDQLASAAPTPGGGAAAAVTVAQGLALLEMVCNLTLGKKKFAAVETEVRGILEQATALRAESLVLAEADMAAFAGVMRAYRLPAETEAEKAEKQATQNEATRQAAQPPWQLMQLAARALPLADRLERIGNPNVKSDVLVGRHLLLAGLAASRENVEVNLLGLPVDDPFAAQLRSRMAGLLATSP